MGNNGEVFVLSDGSIWEVKYEYEYMYEYYPNVIICPDKNLLLINDKKLNVMNLSGGGSSGGSVIESSIDGQWNGWNGNTIVKRPSLLKLHTCNWLVLLIIRIIFFYKFV